MLRSMRKFGLSAALVILTCCFALATAPTISSIAPNPGGIGQSVTIAGSNFGSSGSVTFNGVTASTTSWAATAIIATVPVGATTGNVVVTVSGQSSNGFPFTLNNGPVSYIYDDLGRLVAVIDVKGNAAEYSYDAVGNILSISRFTSTQVSIVDFTPESGPVGTAVAINGTGFSTTPSQNTVKFHGVTAVVSSATNNQLQVTVPATATTGSISVTSPNGSATSSGAFTVTSSNGVPTITSFSPASGLANAAVNLAGTNFDTTLGNDKLRLNVSQAVVSSVTSTTMATTVPAATASGHFSLLTPEGNATSSQDFYVPFGTHVPGDIGFTARTTPGGSQPVTLGANQIALVLFDAVEGQRASIGVSGSTISSCNLYLISPTNTSIANTPCTGANPYLPPTLLPQSGTYTIGIDPGANGGSLTLSLSEDFLGTITIDGPPVTATTTTLWQDARLTFEATGQRVVVYATNVTNPGASVELLTPSQTMQAFVSINNNPAGQTFFMDTQSLGYGTYQLWVPHNGTAAGSETLQISSVPPDFTGTLTVPSAGTTGPAIRVPTSGNLAVGQNASLTFSGTAGQKLSFNILNSTIGSSYTACYLYVNDPNNNQLAFTYCGTGAGTYLDTITLATTGTYTVLINPQATATGSVSVSINNDQDVTTPAITIGGAAVTPTTTVAGQDVRLSFAATTGQRIVVYATNVTNPGASLYLVTPTGGNQASMYIDNSPSGQTFFMDTQTLATTGTYQLWVQHSGTNIGSETLQIVSVPADFTGTLAVPAAGNTGTATRVPTSGNLAVGQNASLTFSGTTGQKFSFNLTNSTITSCNFYVFDPNNNQVAALSGCSGYVDTITLATTGTYTVSINPVGTATGTVSVSLNNDQDVTTPTISIGGGAITAKTTVAGQDVRLSFSATAGQRVVVLATTVTNPLAYLYLVTPSGTNQAYVQINNNPTGQTFFIDTQTLVAGTYQLWVQHSGTNFGNQTLQIKTVPADIAHTVTIGGAAYQFSTVAGQNANITFSNSTSRSVTVHWTNGTYPTTPSCNMTVTGPSPSTTQVGFGYCNTATGALSLGTLSSGTYNIFVDPQSYSVGGMSLTVTTP